MKINKDLEKMLNIFTGKYPSFSHEQELVRTVSWEINKAVTSSNPDKNLVMAEECIEDYKRIVAGRGPNKYLVEELGKIVENAREIYCKVEVTAK